MRAYQRLYRAVRDMCHSVPLTMPVARKIARRAGLRVGPGSGPRTIIEGIIHADEDPRGRIYYAEFGAVAFIRMTSRSDATVYLSYLTETEPANDGAGVGVYGTDELGDVYPVSASRSDTGLGWLRLSGSVSDPVRLGLGMVANEISLDANAFDGPFAFAVQVK